MEQAAKEGKMPEAELLEDHIILTEKQVQQYFPLWLRHRATGKKHLLSQLMNELEEPYFVVDEIENIYQRILSIIREEQNHG